jgi:hypothetical protein
MRSIKRILIHLIYFCSDTINLSDKSVESVIICMEEVEALSYSIIYKLIDRLIQWRSLL